jgi:hypothetical protein
MEDYWRPIQGYTDRYLVSRNGEIWSIKRQIILSTHLRKGYPSVSLYDDSGKWTISIHTLMGETFLVKDDDPAKTQVNHKNGVKTDDRVENLEWTTPRGNNQHALETGLRVPRTKKVGQYTLEGQKLATFDSIKEAAEKTGCNAKHIPSVCRGKRESTGGYNWQYENEEDKPHVFVGTGVYHPYFPKYIIQSNGQVYSTITNRYMKHKIDPDGYHLVGLSNNGFKKDFLIHVLVAQCYIPPDPNKPVVNHMDTDKSNNNVDNLEWCTSSHNALHAIANLGPNNVKIVSQYTMKDVYIMTFESARAAKNATDIDDSSIVKCCKGKARHAGGYIWKYGNKKDASTETLESENSIIQNSPINDNTVENLVQDNLHTVINTKSVSQYKMDGTLLATFPNSKIAIEITGTSHTGINKCCTGTLNSSGGFIWKRNN